MANVSNDYVHCISMIEYYRNAMTISVFLYLYV
jgi:hypothetical protein